jgi:mannosyl-oligosaccharide alpha-1,2-mannosidase
MFDEAMVGMKTNLLREWKTDDATGEKYSYVSPIGGHGAGSMEHLACFVPGMLVLGAAEAPTPALADEYVQIAKDIARTCVAMYSSQPCGLSADSVRFNSDSKTISNIDGKNIQRPETVESLFYLYRKTGDEIYRTQAWDIFQSMERAYRVPESGGWQGVLDVSRTPTVGDDKMQSFFLAETLKYLYLIFADSDTMHLDEWVFNTEAHPFKITKHWTNDEPTMKQ